MIRDLIRFLDNVLQFFIDNAGDEISRARYSATQERSLGLGAMGWHSYLHKNHIPFDSELLQLRTFKSLKHIKSEAVAETEQLAKNVVSVQTWKVQDVVTHIYWPLHLMQTVLLSVVHHHLLNLVRQMHTHTEPVLVHIWSRTSILKRN